MSDPGTLLLLALLVVCPLVVFWLLREGHGGSGEGDSHGADREPPVRLLTPMRPEDWRHDGLAMSSQLHPNSGKEGIKGIGRCSASRDPERPPAGQRPLRKGECMCSRRICELRPHF